MLPAENQNSNLAAQIAYEMIPTLTDYLRTTAETAGWPENVIRALSVEFDGNNVYVDYPDNFANIIDDLEYGKPYGLPNPVIYPFIMRSMPYVSDVFSNTALDEIMDMEEVF